MREPRTDGPGLFVSGFQQVWIEGCGPVVEQTLRGSIDHAEALLFEDFQNLRQLVSALQYLTGGIGDGERALFACELRPLFHNPCRGFGGAFVHAEGRVVGVCANRVVAAFAFRNELAIGPEDEFELASVEPDLSCSRVGRRGKSRLTRLRQEWRVQVSPGSLVTITQAAIVAAGQDPKIPIKAEYSDVPPTLVDATQMEKVIVNLILNSRDAMPEGGPISIRTYALDSWGVVSVQDQGCGMTAEFVRRSLFRPFQTTKRNGLGIGMFHCKTIVDAHGGRMEVETSPGRGTTVQVLLPLAPNP